MLTSDTAQLWLAFADEIADADLLADYRRLLTDEERRKEARFYFAHDRRLFLITRALVRTVLSRYAPIAPAQWRFAPDPHGRPQILNEEGAARQISFNLSHTRGLVVLGVTCDRSLGVDVEHVGQRRADLQIAEHYFSAPEVVQLRATPKELQQARFFDYWTLKEAYIKARGLGLSLPLDQFSFDLSQPHGVRIRFHPPLIDEPSRWSFWQLRASADHCVAVCAERAGEVVPQLSCTRIVPLRREAALEYEELRRSE